MKQKSKFRRMIDSSRTITVASVAMVLLILGITIILGLATKRAAALLRSDIGLVAVVDPACGQPAVDSLTTFLASAPFIEKTVARTADEVLERWEDTMGSEELLDVNPFLPEYEITVRKQWTRPDSLEQIARDISRFRCVDHIQVNTDLAAGINRTVSSALLILSIIGMTLLIVSIVLMTNTLKLQLHAQRFVIHTQQYVGAKISYIVRPYVIRAAISGLASALIATAILTALATYVVMIDPIAATLFDWTDILVSAATLISIGPILCALTAMMAAKKYVCRSYDEIFN
ncbi:MAG: permease-like cell division protein FtsX [Paramuribaculum sp.]|nr:permease-like cell division protein FtsX [Paramuribaculum sp.]